MRERHRQYELMVIISPLVNGEEGLNATLDRIRQNVTDLGGDMLSVEQSNPWGRRKFAYPIRKYAEGEASRRTFTEGYYVLCYFNLSTEQITELERQLKLNDAVLRYMLLLVEQKRRRTPVAEAAGIGSDVDSDDVDVDEDDIDANEDEDYEDEGENDEDEDA